MPPTLKDVADSRRGIACGGLAHLYRRCVGVLKMRRKVEKAATELGYSPNALASSLTTGRTKLIGLVSNNFHNPIFLEVFDLFTRGLQERGLRPLLVNLSDETDPANSIRMLRQYSVDGVVVASSTLPPGFAKAFRDAGVPVVHLRPLCQLAGSARGRHRQHRVRADGRARADPARLQRRGLSRRAGIGNLDPGPVSRFHGRAGASPGHFGAHSFAQAYSFNAGRAEMLALLNDKPAQAYFCGDDVLSIGALSAISDSGLKVPGDIG
jgi:DNA-binding LacI/PurR family transcriptional regulator